MFAFFHIYRPFLMVFFSWVNFPVVSHDLHHVTQAGAWPTGVPDHCLCLTPVRSGTPASHATACITWCKSCDRRPWEMVDIYGRKQTVSWEVISFLFNMNQKTGSLHSNKIRLLCVKVRWTSPASLRLNYVMGRRLRENEKDWERWKIDMVIQQMGKCLPTCQRTYLKETVFLY